MAKRAEFEEKQERLEIQNLVFLDESGSTIAMTRTHARAPRGQRAEDSVPRQRGRVITMLGALSLSGLVALMTIEGGTDGEVFVTFLREVLGPQLFVGAVVVMDNLGAHRDERVREVLAEFGAKPLYLPPYSPDLNPIEMAWAKLKSFLRKAKARSKEALDNALALAHEWLSPSEAEEYIYHCGYTIN